MSTRVICAECINKQEELSRLRDEVKRLKVQLHRQERKISEGFFGSSTPSSKKPVKKNSVENDGQNGYCWMFGTKDTSVFRFRQSRSGKVAQEVFGAAQLPGVLVVDRYRGYNKSPCNIQYCYAHLLRDVQDLEKEFPDNEEIKTFVQTAVPLLAEAMNLRSLPVSDDQFYRRAANTKEEIIKTMNSQANHFGIQHIQSIFRENSHRLYHWANNRDVPADNNFAERELRPLVIARKVSFGSHSDAGAKTRETLMTVLKTLKLRTENQVSTAAAFNCRLFLEK